MNKIVLISSYCDNLEKLNILRENIKKIKESGLDVMLNSPILLPDDLISKCDYFFLTKDNPVFKWPERAVYTWIERYINNKKYLCTVCTIDYGWANIYQVKKLSEISLTFNYEYFYHIIYDTIIDDVVLDAFNSEKKCNFYHFHEHDVSFHLMCFDKYNLDKFSKYLSLDGYLSNGGIAEKYLKDLLINSDLEYIIENKYVDDKILFNKNVKDMFNYSKIDNLCFFIVNDYYDKYNIKIFFYNNIENLNVEINNTIYIVNNGDVLNFNIENNNNLMLKYNNISQDIIQNLKNISHNTITIS